MLTDKRTKLNIADPKRELFTEIPNHKHILDSLDSMILSASGWRKVFTADCDRESFTEEISDSDRVLAIGMAKVYSEFVKLKSGKEKPAVLIGMDSRPTGPQLADAICRLFLSEDIDYRYCFIVAAPEIMAATSYNKEIDGFVYLSASHNPVGDNGVKFGLSDGGVINASLANDLISNYKSFLNNYNDINNTIIKCKTIDLEKLEQKYEDTAKWKEYCEQSYFDFSLEILSGSKDKKIKEESIKRITKAVSKTPISVVVDMNGSARSLSIDKYFLNRLGINVESFSNRARDIAHRIVPEGESLIPCREKLEELRKNDSSFKLGYLPDCDGDRGNLVFFNEKTNSAEIIEAQQLFALSVLSEISGLVKSGITGSDIAIAVNGPTSLRIEAIAKCFGASVHRAEVGEANVVNLGEQLRSQGKYVRIIGEGSNGGNITFPGRVRDPLSTLASIVKLLIKDEGLFDLWLEVSGQEFNEVDYSLIDVIETLPEFHTTSAFENEAMMQIKSPSHAVLKENYENVFSSEWNEKKDEFKKKWDITSWYEVNYETINSKVGMGKEFRSGDERGGLKIVFQNSSNDDVAYIWMRGSGTEPVFRILADAYGEDNRLERELLNWHKSMVSKADSIND